MKAFRNSDKMSSKSRSSRSGGEFMTMFFLIKRETCFRSVIHGSFFLMKKIVIVNIFFNPW